MRKAFIDTLCNLAQDNKLIWLLTGDLGFSFLEPFAVRFPERFVNIGVAEQNMAGIAAGLALSGNTVFIYSIANFPVFRCLEQIRNDICYHNANVKIVSVGGGLAYGPAGYTHHGVEDIGVMRLLPNMTVISPADPVETKLATIAIVNHPGPCYLRLGKSNEHVLYDKQPNFELGKAITLRTGTDITIIASGSVLEMSIEAAEILIAQGTSVEVISMPTIQPIDNKTILQSVEKTSRIITIEEHGPGGLATAIAEILVGTKCKFASLQLKHPPAMTAGSQETLRKLSGLSTTHIIDTANGMII